jgi:hypothetical protein
MPATTARLVQERGGEVAVDLDPPLVEAQLGHRPQHLRARLAGQPGVVDQDADVAELLGDRVDQRADLGLVGEIGHKARHAQFVGPVVDPLGGRHDRHRSPQIGQPRGSGVADAVGAAGPGDECYPAVEAVIATHGADPAGIRIDGQMRPTAKDSASGRGRPSGPDPRRRRAHPGEHRAATLSGRTPPTDNPGDASS